MVEILKQNQYVPMSVEKQTAIIYAASKGHLDDLEISKVGTFESELLEDLDQNHRDVLESIVNEGKITKDNEEKLDKSISNFKKVLVTNIDGKFKNHSGRIKSVKSIQKVTKAMKMVAGKNEKISRKDGTSKTIQ